MKMDPEILQRITRMLDTMPLELVMIIITLALTEDGYIKLGITTEDILYPDAEKFWNAQNPGRVMASPLFQYKDKDFYNLCFQVFLTNNTFDITQNAELSINEHPENQPVRKYMRHLRIYLRHHMFRANHYHLIKLCPETETITLGMGRLVYDGVCLFATTWDSGCANSAWDHVYRFLMIAFIDRQFVKGGKVRKLVLDISSTVSNHPFSAPRAILASLSRENLVIAVRSVMADYRKYSKWFDVSETLKIRGSLDGKMIERDEDVREDETIRNICFSDLVRNSKSLFA